MIKKEYVKVNPYVPDPVTEKSVKAGIQKAIVNGSKAEIFKSYKEDYEGIMVTVTDNRLIKTYTDALKIGMKAELLRGENSCTYRFYCPAEWAEIA